MSTDWTDEYRAKVRAFMAEHGTKVEVRPREYDWQDDDEVSTYGWGDHAAYTHIHPSGKDPEPGCRWIVPPGARLYERSYSQFNGTFADNADEVGVNVRGCRCACGRYEDVILRWTGSVADMLHAILGMPDLRAEVEL